MPSVLLIGRVESTHQSGTSYQCSPCTAPGESEWKEKGKEREGEERGRERRERREERGRDKRREGRTTRFLAAVILTRSVSIASMFSAPAEKVQFS